MKAILNTLLVLLVISVGAALAAESLVEVPAPTPDEEQAELVEPVADEEPTVEELENMDPDLVEAGACCFADCWEEFGPCLPGCRSELEACKAGC